MRKKRWSVYILKCKNNCLYTGITTDVGRRFTEHVQGKGGSYTRAFGAEKILYTESCRSRSKALKREAQIKKWPKLKKFALIHKAAGQQKRKS